jgi:hypothetical protein
VGPTSRRTRPGPLSAPPGVGVGAGAASDNGTATIGFSNGSLVAVDGNGNPVNDGSNSSAAVNLGTALGEVGIGDGTAATTGNIATAVASLSDSDQKNLKLRCVDFHVLRRAATRRDERY